MYYPIQIPYLLNQAYSQNMNYMETAAADCEGFVICFWEMQPASDKQLSLENIIVADGCIDIVVDYDEQRIGFAGMRQTAFHFQVQLPSRSFGARMKPGAFHQLTGLPATAAMDIILPLEAVWADFDPESFFSLPFEAAQQALQEMIAEKARRVVPDLFTGLFDCLYDDAPFATEALYERLHFSPRQCQRLFIKHYGLTPKMVLSILRFQKCLEMLTAKAASPSDVLDAAGYYDQPHFNKDFKRNLGITPLELIRMYRD